MLLTKCDDWGDGHFIKAVQIQLNVGILGNIGGSLDKYQFASSAKYF